MANDRLQITYVLRGLDRILYSAPPTWQIGTFEQDVEAEGRLVLSETNVTSPSKLVDAKCKLRSIAERFRLAISWRIGCSLKLEQERMEEPNFDPPGEAVFAIKAGAGVRFDTELKPRAPPDEIEQLSAEATRWVQQMPKFVISQRTPTRQSNGCTF